MYTQLPNSASQWQVSGRRSEQVSDPVSSSPTCVFLCFAYEALGLLKLCCRCNSLFPLFHTFSRPPVLLSQKRLHFRNQVDTMCSVVWMFDQFLRFPLLLKLRESFCDILVLAHREPIVVFQYLLGKCMKTYIVTLSRCFFSILSETVFLPHLKILHSLNCLLSSDTVRQLKSLVIVCARFSLYQK